MMILERTFVESLCRECIARLRIASDCSRISGRKRPLGCIGGMLRICVGFLHLLTCCRTWVLTDEDIVDPPRRLAEECRKLDIEDDAFVTCDIGETLFF
jgi:hypothetical protein